ncbi:uncharacterized protein LOC142639969 [Castanea sativa]|uniref:uncharacterized protein LOC142639969 n=1 Tax=Castanea sativa TaxID=21020 RepID=UPI003F64D8F7
MAKFRDGNPTNCHDIFHMTLDLFYHLVDELKYYGYLREGKGRVDVQESVAIFLYIFGHNTQMQPMADRFQHSTETVDHKFRRVLWAVHTYGQLGMAIFAQPTGSYYLVDSGYPIGASFLPPHKATRYHAQEFKRSSTQPRSGKEFFNYRHSSLRMVIERAFGVLKAHFPILSRMAKYKQYCQRLVVSACCALNNFIRINNRRDVMFNKWENLDIDRDDIQTRNNGNSRVKCKCRKEACKGDV